jgi:AraC family transcriptional regulator of adaptative response / DNA-3-methyladenine glycosylase II
MSLVQGVVTTRIYCRPSCSARPKPSNVRRFASAEEARAAGFRACKRCHPDAAAAGALRVRLPYDGPLDAGAMLAFFAARALPGVEEAVDGGLRRSLRLRHGAAVVELRAGDAPGEIGGWLWLEDRGDRDAALRICRRLLDLDADAAAIAAALGSDELIAPLVASSPGRRVPGAADATEIAVRAVLGQQISVAGARTIAGRLVAAHGEPLERPVGGVTHLFPAANALAAADPAAWPMPASRKRALAALTGALAGGLDLGDRDELLGLPGIGAWTADLIAMRWLRDPDVFLSTDLGVKRALERLGADPSPRAAARHSERWRPFRSYALQHLWGIA